MKRLKVMQEEKCYDAIDKTSTSCMRKSCRQWLPYTKGKNCLFLTTKTGPLTLNEIGKIYGLTRMRICQIEKGIYQKIRSFIKE